MAVVANGMTAPEIEYNLEKMRNDIGEPSFYNMKVSNTRILSAARARVRVGSQPGGTRYSFAFYGDSRFAGVPGETPSLGVTGRIAAVPRQVAKMLNDFGGIPAVVDSLCGSSGEVNPTNYDLYNSTFSDRGAGWIFGVNISTGGNCWANNNNTDLLPVRRFDGGAFDTIDVWALDSASRTLDALISPGGSSVANFVTGGAGVLRKFTMSLGSSTTVAYLRQRNTSSPVSVNSVIARNAANVELEIYNLGRAGWRASNLTDTSTAFASLNALISREHDFVFCNTGTNDGLYAKTLSGTAITDFTRGSGAGSFKTDYQAIIDAVKGYGGGFAIVVPAQSQPSTQVPQDIQDQINLSLYELAIANDVPLIDLALRNGSYATAAGNGLISGGLHETRVGYNDHASAITDFIMRA